MERWLSGRKRHPAKVLFGQPDRGFESLPLRQDNLLSDDPTTQLGGFLFDQIYK